LESKAYKVPSLKLEESSVSAASLSPYHMAVTYVEAIITHYRQRFTALYQGGDMGFRSHIFLPRSQPVILRRSDFFKIKALPKPPEQQLGLLLGMNLGFRGGEITGARFEHFDVEEGIVYVADSKDKCLYPLPLTYELAEAYHKCLPREGFVLRRHHNCKKREGMSVGKKWFWKKLKHWASEAKVLNWEVFTPNHLRSFFAKEWVRERYLAHEDPNIPLLSKMMRHRDVVYTWVYLTKFVYLEDLRKELQRFQLPVHPQKVIENGK